MCRTRCGKPACHYAQDEGYEAWTLTFMSRGRRRVERIPKAWVEEVRQRVGAGRDFQQAVAEVLTANAELLLLARKQESKHPSLTYAYAPCAAAIRLDATVTRGALIDVVRQAKRDKAFLDSGCIGLALDGTGAERSQQSHRE